LVVVTDIHEANSVADPALVEKLERVVWLKRERKGARRVISQVLKMAVPLLDLRWEGVFRGLRSVIQPCDVAVVSYTFQAHIGRLARSVAKTLILDAHNVEWQTRRQHARSAGSPIARLGWLLLAVALRRFEQREIVRYDGVWAVSERDAEWFRTQYPWLHVAVVPNSALTGASAVVCPLSVRRPVVLFVGRLDTVENIRGVEWLLQHVAPLVWERRPDVEFTIAGRDPVRRVVALMTGKRPVRIVPNPDTTDDLYAEARVVAVPVAEGGGSRVKILEAFERRVPVVSTTTGAAGLEITSGDHLLLADQPRQFADALLQVVSDGRLAEALADSGARLFRRRHSIEAVSESIEGSLRALVAEPA
jgi:glycosyltransferase involved in cell wall biosynthesis